MSSWSDEYWEADGTSLHTQAWGVEKVIDSIPPRRGGNFTVPYRHGELWRPKFYGPRGMALIMWVTDQDADGRVGGIPQLRKNVETLKQLFAKIGGELVLKRRIKLASERYARLPGTSGADFSTPDSAANSVTGDIDIRVKASMDDWVPATDQNFISKWISAPSLSYYFGVEQGQGRLRFRWSADGSTAILKDSTTSPVVTDGETLVVRATMVASTGQVAFYTSLNDGLTYVPLGTLPTPQGATTIADTNVPLRVGTESGTTRMLIGNVRWAEVRSGINGPVAARFDAADAGWGIEGASSAYSSASGELWTRNGAASIVQPVTVRTARAECVGTLGFEADDDFAEIMRFAVELHMADPFWYGDTQLSATVPFAGGTVYNPGTATAQKMLIRLNGPLTNPRLENQSTDRPVQVTYTGTIAAGDWVELDTELFTAYHKNGSNVIGNVSHSGGKFWMELAPGGNALLFTVGTGSGDAVITFYPPYF